MKKYIQRYFISLLSFLALDSVWLGYISPSFYQQYIGHLMAQDPNFVAAGLFYVIFIGGLVYFAVNPGIESDSNRIAALRGAVYGLTTYATFDLTSQAVFRDWPTIVTVVDLTWGTVLSSGAAALSVIIQRKIIKH